VKNVKTSIFVLVVSFAILVACTPVETGDNTPTADPTPEIGVTRDLPDKIALGATATVTLHIKPGPQDTYYIIEEAVPDVFEVTDRQVDKKNRVKIVELQNSQELDLTYMIKAPMTPGAYDISGQYAMDHMEKAGPIMGDSVIMVG